MSPLLEGMFVDVASMKYQDLTKPWYSQKTIDNNLINGKMYYVSDIIGLEAVSYAEVMFINRNLFNDFKLELPYNDVFAGTWTIDKLMTITKSAYNDVNGNTTRDGGDQYGYVSIANNNAWLTSLGVDMVEISSDGTLKDIANSEKMVTVIEKVYNLFYNSDGTFLTKGTDAESGLSGMGWMDDMFASGKAMIVNTQLNRATGKFRKSSVEYGIIPYPKLDENQEKYVTTAYSGNFIAVPKTVENLENTSIILEALLAESYKTVIPTYMETALKDKYTNDEESRKALDIIFESLTVPFGTIYMEWTGYGSTLSALMNVDNPSSDFSSYYAQRKSAVEAQIKKVQEFFQSDN